MKRILIVGGYGHVGQKIARRLVALGQTVTLAGRDGAKAAAAAARLGCEGATLDLNRPESWSTPLSATEVVICCMDTPTAEFARAVLARGARYIDISATDAVLRRIEALDGLAQERDTLAVVSVGLAPGLSNLLVREARARHPAATRFRIGVLLGLGDSHGPAAIDWTLRSLAPLSRTDFEPVRFGSDRWALPSIPFDFADQHSLIRRGYPKVETRLALASPLIFPRSLQLLAWMAGRSTWRKALQRSMPFLRLGNDRAALVVEAYEGTGARPAIRLSIEGRREAEITAQVAAEVAMRTAEMPAKGVRHIDELMRLADIQDALSAQGIVSDP
ncbi:saccharopine dehydrogenase NADP-binding domain-containing protein [Salipiger mangrovisoli]|uniref:Saccharopine dehydrogenase NADP-binding domain-containing protein n=1 Tax=Salipiger mangrovisoli TaxID=2865933 RepID=A0ABR9X945_9RHOB|nr:saccharopine dehydrogenase NADP-binding domain-containing protein [Salipiger mangrovisoli]MBE9640025.1 saccharopine dehydrogenase NADP-binding domain-containing protein [Salipiger mangrovisoli]